VLQRAQIAIGFGEWDRWWQADPELRGIIISGGERPPATPAKKRPRSPRDTAPAAKAVK
jgi:hypothetical protein